MTLSSSFQQKIRFRWMLGKVWFFYVLCRLLSVLHDWTILSTNFPQKFAFSRNFCKFSNYFEILFNFHIIYYLIAIFAHWKVDWCNVYEYCRRCFLHLFWNFTSNLIFILIKLIFIMKGIVLKLNLQHKPQTWLLFVPFTIYFTMFYNSQTAVQVKSCFINKSGLWMQLKFCEEF